MARTEQGYWSHARRLPSATDQEDESLSTARRRISTVLGIGLLAVAAAALTARFLPIPNHYVLYLVIASPYLLFAAPVGLIVLAWGRRKLLSGIAVLLTVAVALPQLPWYVRTDAEPDGVPIRAMTFNMLYGEADPSATVQEATGNADVVLVQELTKEAALGLTAAGIDDMFPYKILDPRPEAAGVGIYSRYPITDSKRVDGFTLATVSARIRVDGVTRDPTLLSLHLAAPWPQPIGNWHGDIARLPATLADLAAQSDGGAVLVGGDFNSTIDMQPFRALLTDGYAEAAEQAGGGRQRTYAANWSIPPLMGIDHFLTRGATATSTQTVEIPGSDHFAVLATITVPRN